MATLPVVVSMQYNWYQIDTIFDPLKKRISDTGKFIRVFFSLSLIKLPKIRLQDTNLIDIYKKNLQCVDQSSTIQTIMAAVCSNSTCQTMTESSDESPGDVIPMWIFVSWWRSSSNATSATVLQYTEIYVVRLQVT